MTAIEKIKMYGEEKVEKHQEDEQRKGGNYEDYWKCI